MREKPLAVSHCKQKILFFFPSLPRTCVCKKGGVQNSTMFVIFGGIQRHAAKFQKFKESIQMYILTFICLLCWIPHLCITAGVDASKVIFVPSSFPPPLDTQKHMLSRNKTRFLLLLLLFCVQSEEEATTYCHYDLQGWIIARRDFSRQLLPLYERIEWPRYFLFGKLDVLI